MFKIESDDKISSIKFGKDNIIASRLKVSCEIGEPMYLELDSYANIINVINKTAKILAYDSNEVIGYTTASIKVDPDDFFIDNYSDSFCSLPQIPMHDLITIDFEEKEDFLIRAFDFEIECGDDPKHCMINLYVDILDEEGKQLDKENSERRLELLKKKWEEIGKGKII